MSKDDRRSTNVEVADDRIETEMKWIGLTGGISSGKSTATKVLRELGYPVVCADELSREVVASGQDGFREVVKAFGEGVVGPDGELDRKKIAGLVFRDSQQREVLETIIHPRVQARRDQLRDQFERQGHLLGFYDVPLLFEKKLEHEFDAVVLVDCTDAQQLERLINRDHLSEDEARRRISVQMPMAEKRKRADFVVDNSGSRDELPQQIKKMLLKLAD